MPKNKFDGRNAVKKKPESRPHLITIQVRLCLQTLESGDCNDTLVKQGFVATHSYRQALILKVGDDTVQKVD